MDMEGEATVMAEEDMAMVEVDTVTEKVAMVEVDTVTEEVDMVRVNNVPNIFSKIPNRHEVI